MELKEFYCDSCVKNHIGGYYEVRGFKLCEPCMDKKQERFPHKKLKCPTLYHSIEKQKEELEKELKWANCQCCPCCECTCPIDMEY